MTVIFPERRTDIDWARLLLVYFSICLTCLEWGDERLSEIEFPEDSDQRLRLRTTSANLVMFTIPCLFAISGLTLKTMRLNFRRLFIVLFLLFVGFLVNSRFTSTAWLWGLVFQFTAKILIQQIRHRVLSLFEAQKVRGNLGYVLIFYFVGCLLAHHFFSVSLVASSLPLIPVFVYLLIGFLRSEEEMIQIPLLLLGKTIAPITSFIFVANLEAFVMTTHCRLLTHFCFPRLGFTFLTLSFILLHYSMKPIFDDEWKKLKIDLNYLYPLNFFIILLFPLTSPHHDAGFVYFLPQYQETTLQIWNLLGIWVRIHLFLRLLPMFSKSFENPFFRLLRDSSFFVYMFHGLIAYKVTENTLPLPTAVFLPLAFFSTSLGSLLLAGFFRMIKLELIVTL